MCWQPCATAQQLCDEVSRAAGSRLQGVLVGLLDWLLLLVLGEVSGCSSWG